MKIKGKNGREKTIFKELSVAQITQECLTYEINEK